jgi:hypothetical protein
MSRDIDIADARDLLDEQRNQRAFSGEKLLLWELLYKCYLDLNIVTYRTRCLAFLEGEHYSRICELLELDPVLVRDAMLNARPPKKTKRGRKRGPIKPYTWARTFDSSMMGVSSNVNLYLS